MLELEQACTKPSSAPNVIFPKEQRFNLCHIFMILSQRASFPLIWETGQIRKTLRMFYASKVGAATCAAFKL